MGNLSNEHADNHEDISWLPVESQANYHYMSGNFEKAMDIYQQLVDQFPNEQYYRVAYYLCQSRGFMNPLAVNADNHPVIAEEYRQFLVDLREAFDNKILPEFTQVCVRFDRNPHRLPPYIVSLLLNIKNKLREGTDDENNL